MLCKIDCRQSSQNCIVRDTFGTITWQLQPERRRLGQYECRRATGEFRGRAYEAWYAVEIPVPSGPYKLGGLPGLILEARSLDDRVKFLFAGIDISVKIPGKITPPSSGKRLNMTYREFIEGEIEFCKNLEKEANARGTITTVTLAERIELSN
ncbi:MAG: GLPGLI family protein [Nitrosomonas sp.]|nr:GLPGLI family protein [Nitrosomonas sp.]